MKPRHLLLTAFCICFAPVSSFATLLLDESFSYLDGTLTAANGGANVSGGAWTNLSGTGTPLTVAGGALVGITHGSGSREDAARPFTGTDIATGTLFAAFTLTVTTAPTAGSDYFFAMTGLANTNYRGRLFLSAPAVAGASFRLGIENDGSSTTFLTPDLATGTYAVLVAVNQTTNLGSLWVDASFANMVEGSPTVTDTVAAPAQALGRVAVRQGSAITGANSINVDDVRVADTFGEATNVPEPTALVSLLGGVGMLMGFRRLRGSARNLSRSPRHPTVVR